MKEEYTIINLGFFPKANCIIVHNDFKLNEIRNIPINYYRTLGGIRIFVSEIGVWKLKRL